MAAVSFQTPKPRDALRRVVITCEEVVSLTITCLFTVSGLSAAHTIYLAGGNVVVLDKQGFFGGNSTKATSGINGALTRTQVDTGIQDSVKQFYDDTLKSARDKARPDLIKVLTYKSAAAVEWLQDVFNLDLTLVSRLGYVLKS